MPTEKKNCQKAHMAKTLAFTTVMIFMDLAHICFEFCCCLLNHLHSVATYPLSTGLRQIEAVLAFHCRHF